MNGLLIRSPWIDKILAGGKVWEIRGVKTNIRGTIALIMSGSGRIFGTCDLVNVEGPLTLAEMRVNAAKHQEPLEALENGLSYERTYAWVLDNVQAFVEPIAYKHPPGAIIWVKLPETTEILCGRCANGRLPAIGANPFETDQKTKRKASVGIQLRLPGL